VDQHDGFDQSREHTTDSPSYFCTYLLMDEEPFHSWFGFVLFLSFPGTFCLTVSICDQVRSSLLKSSSQLFPLSYNGALVALSSHTWGSPSPVGPASLLPPRPGFGPKQWIFSVVSLHPGTTSTLYMA